MPGLRLITPPDELVVSVFEAMQHLRVDNQNETATVASLLRVAQQDLEAREGRLMGVVLVTQTWELILDAFPACEIRPPLRPLQSVVSLNYDDAQGIEQTMPPEQYVVDTTSFQPRIVPMPTATWPGTADHINAVRLQMVVGYGRAYLVPEFYRQAVLLMVGHLYAHRGDSLAEPGFPPSYDALIGVRGRL